MYPNHTSPRRPIVVNNDLVKKDIDCSKADEKGVKQDSKYLQPRWCPSGLSHTQKRRLQRMRKKDAMEQQVEAVPKMSAITKKVWRPKQVVSTSTWLEQVMANSYLSLLAQIMADVLLIIALRQFWFEECFSPSKLYQKKRGGICWQPKLASTGLVLWPVR